MPKPISTLIFLLAPFFFFAQNYPDRPLNYVTDNANVINDEQETLLNVKLSEFELTSSNQIFVYTTASLDGNDMVSLSQEIFHHWKIGGEKHNNGVLIAVFVNDHTFRIHTGYGLEGALPDLLTKRIQDDYMRPLFKTNNFYEGINSGIDQLIYYSANEYRAPAKPEETEQPVDLTGWFLGYGINLLLLIIVIVILYRKPSKKRKPVIKGLLLVLAIMLAIFPCIGAILLFFMAMFTANIKLSRSSGGTYSSSGSGWSDSSWSNSSSDSYSDSSSSDFSGGGGGDSGGGGSSSDW